MLYVRHRSAAGGREPCWEYDPIRKVVRLVLARGPAFGVDVCSTSRPRFGAFPVIRHDPCTWKLVPARYTASAPGGRLETHTCALHEDLGRDAVMLLDAPDSVAIELAELDR